MLNGLEMKLNLLIRKTIFKVYSFIPFTDGQKIFLKNLIFKNFFYFFKNTVTYKNWKILNQHLENSKKIFDKPSIDLSAYELKKALTEKIKIKKNNKEIIENDIIDIILPVYKDLEITKKCIESILKSLNTTSYNLIIINDRTPDPNIKKYLKCLIDPRIILVENEKNLGFVKSVNIGMSFSKENSIIILNSDTIVPDHWIDNLYYHSKKNDRLGSISPFSNNATICNFMSHLPFYSFPKSFDVNDYNKACYLANTKCSIETPTTVGFCMFINRKCIVETGFFDDKTFGKGYGEENDFCLRSTKLGWKHYIAMDTFVYHEGEVSFTNPIKRKNEAQKLIEKKYPNYNFLINAHMQKNEIVKFRLRAIFKLFQIHDFEKELLISHNLGGGIDTYINSKPVSNSILFVMKPILNKPHQINISSLDKKFNFDFNYQFQSLNDISFLFEELSIKKIHLHHRIGYSFDIDYFVNKGQIPYDYYLHDYYSICPRLFLNRTKGGYCGEPKSYECNLCLNESVHHIRDEIEFWRQKNLSILVNAETIIAPSRDTRRRIKKHFPDLKIHKVSHEKIHNYNREEIYHPKILPTETFRIALIGVLSIHKGKLLLEEIIKRVSKKNLKIHFHIVGYPEGDISGSKNYFSFTGPYSKEDEINLIKKFNPHLILFMSNVPETYSFTLTSALKLKLPIIATRLGSLPERLVLRKKTWLFDNNSVDDLFKKIIDSRNELENNISVKTNNHYRVSSNYLKTNSKKSGIKRIFVAVIGEKNGYAHSPCSYIRLIKPLEKLNKEKFVIQFIDYKDIDYEKINVLIIQRIAIRDICVQNNIIEKCKNNNVKIIYEIDDLLINMPKFHVEYKIFETMKSLIIKWIVNSDQVWVSTPKLKEHLSVYSDKIIVFGNFINMKLNKKESIYKKNKKFRILYFGGPGHLEDLKLIEQSFENNFDFIKKYIHFDVIGLPDNYKKPYFNHIRFSDVEFCKYPLFTTKLSKLKNYDLGLIPLVENDFNLCKSNIKFLDYTNLGLISMGSNIGSISNTIVDKKNGILIDNAKANWVNEIQNIMENEKFRSFIKNNAIKSAKIINSKNQYHTREKELLKLGNHKSE